MTTSNVPPPREATRGPEAKPAAARLSLNGTIRPNEGEKLPSLNRLNDPNVKVGSFEDKTSARLVNTNAGFFSGGDGTANAAIGVGVNAKAVTFTIGSVISNELLQSVDQTRSSLVEESVSFIDENIADVQEATLEKERVENLQKGFNSFDDVRLRRLSENDTRKESSPILPRFFEDRSYLIFYSPQVKYIMPFFENPTIEEKRLVNYSMINQAGSDPIINYQWTNLAEVRVNFKLSYRHVAEILQKEGLDANSFNFASKVNLATETIGEVSKFFDRKNKIKNNDSYDFLETYKKLLKTSEREFFSKITESGKLKDFFDIERNRNKNGGIRGDQYTSLFSSLDGSDKLLRAKALCAMWLYIIKSWAFGQGNSYNLADVISDINNTFTGQTNPNGPNQTYAEILSKSSSITNKFIIIKHGPIFHYIPGILTNYDIKETQNTTYDLHTIMAHSFDVNLTILCKPDSYDVVSRLFGDQSAGSGELFQETLPFNQENQEGPVIPPGLVIRPR